jgi:predicted nuclease with TOPRIM domain
VNEDEQAACGEEDNNEMNTGTAIALIVACTAVVGMVLQWLSTARNRKHDQDEHCKEKHDVLKTAYETLCDRLHEDAARDRREIMQKLDKLDSGQTRISEEVSDLKAQVAALKALVCGKE